MHKLNALQIAAAVFIGALILLLLVYQHTKRVVPSTPPQQIIRVVPTISIDSQYGPIPSNVVFTYTGKPMALPKSLPVYTTVFPSDLTLSATSVARFLGFLGSQKNPVPYVSDWTNDAGRFSYNTKAKEISYYSSTPPSTLTPDSLIQLLRSNHFISDNLLYIEKKREKQSGVGEGGTTSALTSIFYQAVPQNQPYPFYLTGPSLYGGVTHIASDGAVMSFSFVVTPTITLLEEGAVISFDDVLKALNSNAGYLSWVGTNEIAYGAPAKPTYTQVQISSISPAFLFIPTNNTFVPIFVCEGSAQGGASGPQLVRYYVNALGK